jgi:hypothetical protein
MTFKNYKEGDTITEKEYGDINTAVYQKWNTSTSKKLEENKTVFFNKNVQTSRTEFKKQFPTNKIVKYLKEADYYITNNAPSQWISFYNIKTRILNRNEFGSRLENVINNLNECVDFVNNANNIINSAKIIFKAENEELPQEMKEKLINMLSSKDGESFNLGWKILFEYNHIKCMDEFHLIISKADPIGFYRRKKTRVIEQKLKQIKANYPNSRY